MKPKTVSKGQAAKNSKPRGATRKRALEIPPEEARELHYYLRLTREVDERLVKLHRQGQIGGNHYPAVGQEATTVVPAFFMEDDDFVGPSHRELGVFITKGRGSPRSMPLVQVFAQVFTKSTSQDEGRNGPSHWGWTPERILEHCSNLGTQIPVAAGAALSFKMRGLPLVAFAFIGEGGASKGDFHEACNFVGIHKLPFVIIIQNNFWAESVHISLQTGNDNLSDRAIGYGYEGIRIDGNDVIQCYQTFKYAIDKARTGGGPTMIQCDTYRWYGHSMVDPANYRTGSEVSYWKELDPVARFERWLVDNGVMTQEEIDQRVKEINEQIFAAIDEAKSAPDPEPETFLDKVYAD